MRAAVPLLLYLLSNLNSALAWMPSQQFPKWSTTATTGAFGSNASEVAVSSSTLPRSNNDTTTTTKMPESSWWTARKRNSENLVSDTKDQWKDLERLNNRGGGAGTMTATSTTTTTDNSSVGKSSKNQKRQYYEKNSFWGVTTPTTVSTTTTGSSSSSSSEGETHNDNDRKSWEANNKIRMMGGWSLPDYYYDQAVALSTATTTMVANANRAAVQSVSETIGSFATESMAVVQKLQDAYATVASTTFEHSDVTYSQALSTVSKSGYGIVQLVLGLVWDSLSSSWVSIIMTTNRDDNSHPSSEGDGKGDVQEHNNNKIPMSATIALLDDDDDDSSRGIMGSPQEPIVVGNHHRRRTYSLSPAKAFEIWGYNSIVAEDKEVAQQEEVRSSRRIIGGGVECFPFQQFTDNNVIIRATATTGGKWMDKILHATATATDMVLRGVASMCDVAMDVVGHFQNDIFFQGKLHKTYYSETVNKPIRSTLNNFFVSTIINDKLSDVVVSSNSNHPQETQQSKKTTTTTTTMKPLFFWN